jgi:hypothetical protein
MRETETEQLRAMVAPNRKMKRQRIPDDKTAQKRETNEKAKGGGGEEGEVVRKGGREEVGSCLRRVAPHNVIAPHLKKPEVDPSCSGET